MENRRLAEDFPEVVGRGLVWRGNSIVLRNGVTIEAFGTGQRIRGRRRREHRPTLIVCDDLQNDGHIGSAVQREHSRSWFHGTLMKAGTARTNVVNLATALHRECLAMELHRTPGWTSRLFKSIVRWPENTSLWQQWEAVYTDLSKPRYKTAARKFYDERRQAMDSGAILLWPEEEDLYTLMCMRIEGGRTAFEREKQNSPINPDLCEWPESYFDETIWFETWPANLMVKTMALDPSKGSDSRHGDFSALVMLGMDRQGMLYVEADQATSDAADGGRRRERFRQFQPDLFEWRATSFKTFWPASSRRSFAGRAFWAPGPRRSRTTRPSRSAFAGWVRTSRRGGCDSRPPVLARGFWSSSFRSSPSATTTTAPTPWKWRCVWRPSCCTAARSRTGWGIGCRWGENLSPKSSIKFQWTGIGHATQQCKDAWINRHGDCPHGAVGHTKIDHA